MQSQLTQFLPYLKSQNAPLSDPTVGGDKLSCHNGTSVNNGVHTNYLSTNGDEKLSRDNSTLEADDYDKDRIDSLSAYGMTQKDKATTLGGLTQVLKPDHQPHLLGAEWNQLDKERKQEDREAEELITAKFEALYDTKLGTIPTTDPTDLAHLAKPMVKSDSDKLTQTATGEKKTVS